MDKKETSYINQKKQKIQSMDWISQAMFLLMRKKKYNEITVSELCEAADLSRRTYYRLFSSKESVITYYLEKLCMEYANSFRTVTDTRLVNVTALFFSYWERHKEVLQLLKKNHLEGMLLEVYTRLLPKVYLDPTAKPIETEDMLTRYYMATFCAGGFATLLLQWMEQGMKQTPSEMQQVVLELVKMNR